MENSELRQDIVSGDWIVVAPGRAKRPHTVKVAARKRAPKTTCPFEDPQKAGNKPPSLIYPDGKNWQLQIVENKYPAVMHHKICGKLMLKGPYPTMLAAGHHDLLITRDHNKNFPHLSKEQANQVFQALRDRYLMLFNDPCLSYIFMLHNWGPGAGASIYHPHYQIIALPVVPPDVQHSLNGSHQYWEKHKKCVHCVMLEYEMKEGKRIIYENEGAVALAPFVSRGPFEVRIFPKKHMPFFENTLDEDIAYVVDALQQTLRRFEKKLKDPDYNFFIHTAPLRGKEEQEHYHWHIEAYPKVSIRAAFEAGTGVEINDVDPDQAAKLLK
ncbi:MAG: HIT domain-containing protein [bacterium]|nr:HIT domain-containing protein [bacterium]